MTRIDSLLGAMHERPTAPDKTSERLDLSRCVTYATRSEAIAKARFRAKYHCDPTVCIQASIGGKTKVIGFTLGLVPENWSERDE